MSGNRRTGQDGIAILIVSGIVVLLAVLAGTLAALGTLSRTHADGARMQTLGELARASGLEYAAGRLQGDAGMRPHAARVPEARSDDWQYRDGADYRYEPGSGVPYRDLVPPPLENSLNPSFSRGESWRDLGISGDTPGAYDRGPDDISPAPPTGWTDLDGDGRFSAWSGRLRGGDAPFAVRFKLRVEPGPTSRINVNGGNLAKPWTGGTCGLGDKVADAGNNPHACWLNLLGGALGIGEKIDLPSLVNPAIEPVRYTDLGEMILSRRPERTGYRSMEELRTALVEGPLPHLTDAEWRVLEPHLALCELDRPPLPAVMGVPPPPVRWLDLNGAPPAVLNAFWTYRKGSLCRSAHIPNQYGRILFNGDMQIDPLTQGFWSGTAVLFPAEAAGLADMCVSRRRLLAKGPFLGLKDFHADCHDWIRENGHVPNDPAYENPSTTSLYAAKKADIVLGTRTSFPPESKYRMRSVTYSHPPLTWDSWEFDRDVTTPSSIERDSTVHANGASDTLPIPDDETGYTSPSHPYEGGGPFRTLAWPAVALWFGPVQTFMVESIGESLSQSGTCRSPPARFDLVARRGIALDTQEDFDNVGTRRTPDLADRPEEPRRIDGGVQACGLGTYADTQSLPLFNRRAFWMLQKYMLNQSHGAVTLAAEYSDTAASPAPTLAWNFPPVLGPEEDDGFHSPNELDLNGHDHLQGIGAIPDRPPFSADPAFASCFAPGSYRSRLEGDGNTPPRDDLSNLLLPPPGTYATYELSLDKPDRMPAPVPRDTALANLPPAPNAFARYWRDGAIEAWVSPVDGSGNLWIISTDGYQRNNHSLPTGIQSMALLRQENLNPNETELRYQFLWTYDIPASNFSTWKTPSIGLNEDEQPNRVEWTPFHPPGRALPVPDHIVVTWHTNRLLASGSPGGPLADVTLRISCNGTEVHSRQYVTSGETPDPHDFGFMPLWSKIARSGGGHDPQMKIEIGRCLRFAIYNDFFGSQETTPPPTDLYTLTGEYRSPLFILPEPARIGFAGWTGLLPPGVRKVIEETPGTPTPIVCLLTPYANAAGTVPLGPAIDLASAGVQWRGLDIAGARSFRYRVLFDVPDDPRVRDLPPPDGGTGVFLDPPVFEEFRLSFAGKPIWIPRE